MPDTSLKVYEIKNLVKERKQGQGYTLKLSHFAIAQGERLALLGASGCGKSTTLDLLGLALAPDEVEAFKLEPKATLSRYDIKELYLQKKVETLADLRRRYIGYVLQTGELLPYLSTLENMTFKARMVGIPVEEAEEGAIEIARKLGLQQHLLSSPAKLSVGERQRVAIIRALLPKPSILLADEPTAALDPLHAGRVMESLLDLVQDQGTTLILVTHDLSLVSAYKMKSMVYSLSQENDRVVASLNFNLS
ncbi:MAG: ATP-binding cassette domain-containing protein [Desulfovibrionaceae bacterium]|nr:ATP-binding cassette domain-containing protein [Desulfovibrionaceae bacterium]